LTNNLLAELENNLKVLSIPGAADELVIFSGATLRIEGMPDRHLSMLGNIRVKAGVDDRRQTLGWIIRQDRKEEEIDARAVANAICGLTDELWKEILFAGESYDREEAIRVCMRFLASIFPWCYEMPGNSNERSQNTVAGPISIIQASAAELDQVSALFDLYRQFYSQKASLVLAKEYIGERLARGSSVIFLALDTNKNPLGFTQLYPSYCSVAAAPIWILYDLYVDSDARNNGVAKALMNRALLLAQETGASRIDLETAIDNFAAQALYESLGYEKETEFYKYSLDLSAMPQ